MTDASCGCPPMGASDPPPGFTFPPDGPFTEDPFCSGVALAILRAYAPGVEPGRVAEFAHLSVEHAEQTLLRLNSRGLAKPKQQKISWYYQQRQALLWVENPRVEFLGKPMPTFEETPRRPDRIPPRLWWVFWSGMDPMFLRLPADAVYVASRMLVPEGSTRHVLAETWALKHLPPRALRELLGKRGYQNGPVVDRIKHRLGVS